MTNNNNTGFMGTTNILMSTIDGGDDDDDWCNRFRLKFSHLLLAIGFFDPPTNYNG